MVGRRRDQANARRRMSCLSDPRVHLAPRQVAALARLCSLRHFNLNFPGVVQVVDMHAEPARGHLLDGAGAGISVFIHNIPLRILAALAAVGFAAQPVHSHRQTLVGLPADGAVGHRPGLKALDDTLHAFHTVNGNRFINGFDIQHTADRTLLVAVGVHFRGILLIELIVSRPARHLQLIDRSRVKHMVFPVGPPFILAAGTQCLFARNLIERLLVAFFCFFLNFRHADTADPGSRSCKVLLHNAFPDTQRLKNLCALIGLDRRNAHFRHNLYDSLGTALDIICLRRFIVQLDHARVHKLPDGFISQIRVHAVHAVAQKTGEMMHLSWLSGFQHDGNLHPRSLPDQMMMQGGRRQQRRDRNLPAVRTPVGQNQDIIAVFNGDIRRLTDRFYRVRQIVFMTRIEQRRNRDRLETFQIDIAQLFQLPVAEDRRFRTHLPAVQLGGCQKILFTAEQGVCGGDNLLPDRVNRRIGDLRKKLLEIVI